MDSDRDYSAGPAPLAAGSGRVPLGGGSGPAEMAGWPGAGDADAPAAGRRARHDSIRQSRRVSNWTAAALIVGTGAATVALAHQAYPAAAPAAATGTATGSGTGATTPGAAATAVTHSVATTSGSGVTVTTTTHRVNGKTVITRVRHVPAYHDN